MCLLSIYMLLRRIKREFENNHYKYELIDTPGLATINFICKGVNVKILLYNDYPYKPPKKIYLDDVLIDHDYFMSQPNDVLLEHYKRKTVNCCICDSFLCAKNWSPCGISLNDVANQIIEYNESIKRARVVVYIRRHKILPLMNEMIENIFEYV